MTNDLISRNAALEILMRYCPDDDGSCSKADVDPREMLDEIESLPAVDAAPVVHGRWIHCAGKSNVWHCSECGGRIMYNQTRKTYNIKKPPVSEANKICKHCGARMDKGE